MTKTEIAWLAGLLEGEGWFGDFALRSGKRRTPGISLCMTDRDVVERAAKLMGDRHVSHLPAKPPRQAKYEVRLSGGPAISVMRTVLPYMGERRGEAIETLLWLYEGVDFRKPYRLKKDDAL